MLIKQISVFVENKPGRLAEISSILAEKNIDIRALSIADTTDFGILRLIVNDPDGAESALKQAGLTVSITRVIGIGVTDRPGGLSGALKLLLKNGIAVEYMYAFIGRSKEEAYVILRVNDNERAAKALSESGYTVLESSGVYGM